MGMGKFVTMYKLNTKEIKESMGGWVFRGKGWEGGGGGGRRGGGYMRLKQK